MEKSIQEQRTQIQWINQIDKRCLPPASARKLVTYRSFESGGKDPLIKEDEYSLIIPPSTVLEGTYSFLDPFNPTRGSVLAKNVSRTEATPEIIGGSHTGMTSFREQIDPVIFDSGFKNVNADTEYGLYVFLELHSLNKSNRFRDTTKAAHAFYRESPQRGRGVELAEADLGIDAEILVREMDFKKVLEYASSIPGNKIPVEGRQPGEVKMDLRKYARTNPKHFFGLLRNTDAVNKFVVAEALDLGFVVFDRDIKAFKFYGEDKPIFEVGKVEGNPGDAFLKFIGTEKGAEAKAMIEAKINYWN